MTFIILTLIPSFFISVVLTRELSANTDIFQFIRRHRSAPWLKDASKLLLNYEDIFLRGNKNPEVTEGPDASLDDPIGKYSRSRKRRREEAEEYETDPVIGDITSDIKKLMDSIKRQTYSQVAKKLEGEFVAANEELSDLRRNKGPKQGALRGLDKGNRGSRNMAKNKAQKTREIIKQT